MTSNQPSTVFTAAGVAGYLHAVDIDSGREFGHHPDVPVAMASVVKVLFALEFGRQVSAGQLDPGDRVRTRPTDRLGGTGIAGCQDDVELSLRDLVWFMMTVSDNTAADLLLDRIGTDNVRSLVGELGLTATRIVGGPRDLLALMADDLAATEPTALARRLADDDPTTLAGLRAYDPAHTNATTARDLTRLLSRIWQDTAGPPDACQATRRSMRHQVNWHRITAAMPETAEVAAKSGSMPGLRHEVAVVTFPDGGRYAVAVLTTGPRTRRRGPEVDAAIGAAARIAIDRLRGR